MEALSVGYSIGNMGDMSIRMVNTLKEVDFIAAKIPEILVCCSSILVLRQISFHEA